MPVQTETIEHQSHIQTELPNVNSHTLNRIRDFASMLLNLLPPILLYMKNMILMRKEKEEKMQHRTRN